MTFYNNRLIVTFFLENRVLKLHVLNTFSFTITFTSKLLVLKYCRLGKGSGSENDSQALESLYENSSLKMIIYFMQIITNYFSIRHLFRLNKVLVNGI